MANSCEPKDVIEIIREMHARHVKMSKLKKKNDDLITDINRGKKKKTNYWENEENVNHYTDASKYAEEFYGKTKEYTTKYDNDWD